MVRLQDMNEYVCLSRSETDYQSANRNPDNVTRLISSKWQTPTAVNLNTRCDHRFNTCRKNTPTTEAYSCERMWFRSPQLSNSSELICIYIICCFFETIAMFEQFKCCKPLELLNDCFSTWRTSNMKKKKKEENFNTEQQA